MIKAKWYTIARGEKNIQQVCYVLDKVIQERGNIWWESDKKNKVDGVVFDWKRTTNSIWKLWAEGKLRMLPFNWNLAICSLSFKGPCRNWVSVSALNILKLTKHWIHKEMQSGHIHKLCLLLKVHYIGIGHLLNSYSRQKGGSISPEQLLITANLILYIHDCSWRQLVSSVSYAASQSTGWATQELWTTRRKRFFCLGLTG